VGKIQWKRDCFYLYGIIEPKTGETYFYEFSHLDNKCFQIFVNQISQAYSDSLNFIQIDNAPAHQGIDWPENIIPIFQPSHSPELNPIERFWEFLKYQLRWKNCENISELRSILSNILNQIEPEVVASLAGWEYIIEAILSATS